ncbi:MAG: Hsp20/alpha crystallin family protein [Candidatus Pacearchaeota archaeon]
MRWLRWRDPFEEIRRFRVEMNNLFDTFFGNDKTLITRNKKRKDFRLFRQPLSDLKETEEELRAYIELPGVDKKDIQLNVTENSLEVKVEKKGETKIEKEGYIRAERIYKGFYRSIFLPSKIIPDQVKASYKDGILEIIMPKVEKKKQVLKAKKVEVQ